MQLDHERLDVYELALEFQGAREAANRSSIRPVALR
jgi:hypothetical protein